MKSYFQQKIATLTRKYVFVFSILLAIPATNQAKTSSTLRKFFNQVHFNFSMGYGRTFYKKRIWKYSIFNKEGNYYLYNPLEGDQTGYLVKWFDKPYIRTHLYESESFLANLKRVAASTSQVITFYGEGHTLPVTLSGHVDIKKKWRIEIGGSVCLHMVGQLIPEATHRALGPYYTSESTHYTTKLFLINGYKLVENAAYSLLVNTQLSYDFVYGNFFKDTFAISSNLWHPDVGIGLTLEKHISEYFSVFGKIMYEKVKWVDKINESFTSVVFSDIESILLQIGVTFNYAEIPRCPLPDCEIEIKHKHTDTSYRGAAFITGKNSPGYRLYKK